MTINTVTQEITDYIASLSATNEVCSELGNTFVMGTNMFVNVEPYNPESLTILLYAGAAPKSDKYKYESNFQLRFKSTSKLKGERIMQGFINLLHQNGKVFSTSPGLVVARQSNPIVFAARDSGEEHVFVANFGAKHVKL